MVARAQRAAWQRGLLCIAARGRRHGFRDGPCLHPCCRTRECSGDFLHAFAAYEKKFRPFIERKQRSAAQFAHSFAPRTRFGLLVRDQVLNLASRFRPVANFLMRQFVWDDVALPRY
jgi:2-polyprenyl-6-methoxyphenol hydroxylase-like FAD-dependent oxidoreductase